MAVADNVTMTVSLGLANPSPWHPDRNLLYPFTASSVPLHCAHIWAPRVISSIQAAVSFKQAGRVWLSIAHPPPGTVQLADEEFRSDWTRVSVVVLLFDDEPESSVAAAAIVGRMETLDDVPFPNPLDESSPTAATLSGVPDVLDVDAEVPVELPDAGDKSTESVSEEEEEEELPRLPGSIWRGEVAFPRAWSATRALMKTRAMRRMFRSSLSYASVERYQGVYNG